MEKPSLAYDISPRFISKIGSNAKTNDRYYDRMTLRGIPVVRDTEDESDKPVWRGDHSFSPDAATYSLMHFIEPEVSREHPDWTQAQVHKQAVERFEKRLAQDLSYEHREIIHEESVVRWHPVQMNNGEVELATEYGDKMVTLSELWEHTKEYAAFAGNPAAYNSAEHEAQLLMQDRLINGVSSGFVSVLSHPDAVRYVQIWQKSEDGDVVSHHVDLYAATGKDFSPEEAKELIYRLSDFHSERMESGLDDKDHSYAHFFVTQGSVLTEDIRTIAIAQSVYVSDVSYEQSAFHILRQNSVTGFSMLTDDATIIENTGLYLRDQIEEKIRVIAHHVNVLPVRHTPVTDATKEKDNVSKALPMLKQEKERPKAKEADAKDVTEVKSVLSERWISQTMLRFVPVLPVAPEAALYWFAVLRQEHLKQAIPEVSARADTRLGNEVSKRAFSNVKNATDVWKAFVSRIKASLPPTIPQLSLRMPLVSEVPVTQKRKDSRLLTEGTLKPKMTEQAWIVLWYDVAKILSRFFTPAGVIAESRVFKDNLPVLEMNQQEISQITIEKKYIPVGRFMFALIVQWLWMSSPAKMNKQATPVAGVIEQESHAGRPAEGAPWILLSIIWYLSMARESGKAVTQAVIPQKNLRPKRKRKKAALPQHGTIFVFAS